MAARDMVAGGEASETARPRGGTCPSGCGVGWSGWVLVLCRCACACACVRGSRARPSQVSSVQRGSIWTVRWWRFVNINGRD